MKTLSVKQAREMQVEDLLGLATQHEGLVLTGDGETQFFIGAVDDLDREAWSLSQNPEFMSYLHSCMARGDREGRLSLAEARSQWGVKESGNV